MSEVLVRAGDVLAGKYRVERILGKGNMGCVVAATHLILHQMVALKFILPGPAMGPQLRERFLREGRAAARLKSQHVARVIDMGILDDGAPYTVMDFLEGSDLKAVLYERGPLPIDEAIEYALHACEALGEAHAARIVHRDIKPANLFLTTDASRAPCIKVVDFGISKLIGAETLTNTQQAIGSPSYMSPEQLNSSKDLDGRADLWSLGATLYELLAGQTPFNAETIEQLFFRIFTAQPASLTEFRSDVPAELDAVIMRCLEKKQQQRFENTAELAAALAPYAPLRARVYAERVARVVAVPIPPVREPSSPDRALFPLHLPQDALPPPPVPPTADVLMQFEKTEPLPPDAAVPVLASPVMPDVPGERVPLQPSSPDLSSSQRRESEVPPTDEVPTVPRARGDRMPSQPSSPDLSTEAQPPLPGPPPPVRPDGVLSRHSAGDRSPWAQQRLSSPDSRPTHPSPGVNQQSAGFRTWVRLSARRAIVVSAGLGVAALAVGGLWRALRTAPRPAPIETPTASIELPTAPAPGGLPIAVTTASEVADAAVVVTPIVADADAGVDAGAHAGMKHNQPSYPGNTSGRPSVTVTPQPPPHKEKSTGSHGTIFTPSGQP